MSSPDFRQPDPAASLKGALEAQRKVTDSLREAAAETREEEAKKQAGEPTPRLTEGEEE